LAGKMFTPHKGELIGKKQDKAGKWRKAKVPNYANVRAQDMS